MKDYREFCSLFGTCMFFIVLAAPSYAATFLWTGLGVANDLDDASNWDQATPPASGSKIGTTSSLDIIRFDSDSATLPTTNLDIVRISSGNKLPNFELLNGTLNINRAENWGWGGTAFTIGDSNMTTLAQANFAAGTVNLNRDGGSKTYIINADGTLKFNANFIFGQNNSRIRLLGGAVDGSGRTVTGDLINNGSNYVIFESFDSTFTLNYGGQLANAAAVTDAFGDSFRLGGALESDPNAQLSIVSDNGTTFVVGVIPEPSSALLLISGLGFFCLRRRP